jgi:predicted enzyme related to lactoylglutathione lyase
VEVVVGQPVRLWIFAADPYRARAFYAQVFGWSLPDGPWHGWLITPRDDPRLGIDGPHPTGVEPAGEAFIPTVHVADLDATTAAALAAGGEVLVARIPLPGVGWLVYLADTEGNLIGVMQDDPDAVWPTPAAAGRRRQVRRRRRSGPGVT